MPDISTTGANSRERVTTMCLIAVAVASLGFVASGAPILRHDWFPIIPSLRFAIDDATGWNPVGLGSVVGYPASFLVIFIRSSVAAAAGPYAAHILFFGTFATLLSFGAASLARALGASPVGRVAAALCAAFNPWTYTEFVAGHGFMLLSYAATFWLLAECLMARPSRLRLALLALAVAPQIQFLLVDAFAFVWLSLRMRSRLVLAAICAVTLPVAVGIAVSRKVLLGIPLTLEWERGQSIDPLRAVFLRGYFTGYDTALPPFFEWSQWAVVGIACIGVVAILVWQRRRTWLIVLTAIPLFWSFGVLGPLAGLFTLVVAHVPEAGLFRELYDLLGFVGIGYVALCALAGSRFRVLEAVWFVAAAGMLVAWLAAPPSRFWVLSQTLPGVTVNGSPNSRVLLTPPLYPLRLGDNGSGTDPDLYARDENVTPLNQAFPLYPVAPAIGAFLRDGSTKELAALGVSHIVARPWLRTDPSIRFQMSLPPPPWLLREVMRSATLARPLSELSMGEAPAIGTLDTNFGAGNVLFSDAAEANGSGIPVEWRRLSAAHVVAPTNSYVDASLGWTDARLAFVEYPELAQPFGGALTTNPTEALHITPAEYALVFIRGRLVDDSGRIVATNSPRYRWVFLPREVRAVRCVGLCVVAAQTLSLPDAPLDPAPHESEPLAFQAPIPWLVTAVLPAGEKPLLRYDVTYDSMWDAYYAGALLPHVRIDGIVNGWLVPPRARSARVFIIEIGAALIALSELVSAVWIFIVIYCALRKSAAVRADRIEATAKSDNPI